MIAQNDLNTAKLAHYNAWLLDANREFGTVYPGFPGEVKVAKAIATTVVVKSIAKRARGTVTKLDQAKALFKANYKLSRVNMIALLQEKLQMSKAGATTYYYNAQK
jgi:hypothetical protein